MRQPQVRLKIDLPPMRKSEAEGLAREMAATLRTSYSMSPWTDDGIGALDIRPPKVRMRKQKARAADERVMRRG
jgi:hypothetical protein